MDGFLIVDKPEGMTSQTVCNRIKHKYNSKKCGHNGTLDPMTTGVMIVALGKATKMLNYLHNDDKKYVTTVVFGYDSDTLDVFGEVEEKNNLIFKLEELDFALDKMKCINEQVPPIVSAIKVNGRKLLDYARKNIDVEIKSRDVKIYELRRISELRLIDGHLEVDIFLHVSKGFYVRSFARDLGLLLNSSAIMKKLRRVDAGKFNEKDSLTLDYILNNNITPLKIEDVFNYPIINANQRILKFIKNGVTIYPFNLIKDCKYNAIETLSRFYFSYDGELIALYEKQGDIFRPLFMF